MKVSVIIPVYNVYDYLRECVESVKKLKTEAEIILVNDGSTDKSGDLCDELAKQDERIRVIHKENGGLSSARNKGIENAVGEYLLFLDSDDFIDPEKTDALLSFADGSTEIVMGLYNNYFTESNSFEPETSPAFLKKQGVLEMDEFLNNVPQDGRTCYMVAWRFIVKRDFLLQNNLFFLPRIYHEDEEWTERLFCAANKIFVTGLHFYQYRQARAGSITGKVSIKHLRDRFTIIERYEQNLSKLPISSAKKEYLACRAAQLYLGNMIDWHKLDKTAKKEVLSKLKAEKHLAKNLKGGIGQSVKFCQSVFSVAIACRLLGLADKIIGG